MSASKKFVWLIGILGIAILTGLVIFSACDQRKSLNPVENIIYKIDMTVNPQPLVIYSPDSSYTVYIDIYVYVLSVKIRWWY